MANCKKALNVSFTVNLTTIDEKFMKHFIKDVKAVLKASNKKVLEFNFAQHAKMTNFSVIE